MKFHSLHDCGCPYIFVLGPHPSRLGARGSFISFRVLSAIWILSSGRTQALSFEKEMPLHDRNQVIQFNGISVNHVPCFKICNITIKNHQNWLVHLQFLNLKERLEQNTVFSRFLKNKREALVNHSKVQTGIGV